jgi:hypothetical protein
MLLSGAVLIFLRDRTASSMLQILGAACLVLAVLLHVWEGLHFLLSMGWGEEGSIDHYIVLGGAMLGLMLFPIGYRLHAYAEDRVTHNHRLTSMRDHAHRHHRAGPNHYR